MDKPCEETWKAAKREATAYARMLAAVGKPVCQKAIDEFTLELFEEQRAKPWQPDGCAAVLN